jgi:Carboxypeptidase regulatory-like domain/TonB-dependent Receptor Plug Domain
METLGFFSVLDTKWRYLRLLSCALLVLFFAPPLMRAQDTGSITGTVHDVSGSVILGAEVKVSSPAIGLAREITTNSEGDYLAGGLPAGTYEVTVTAKGFKSFSAKNIILQVAEKKRVDVTLQLGEISEKVVVEGTNVAQVETQSSDLSGVVTGKQISQLELNGRNFTQLITLVPGVTNASRNSEGAVGGASAINFEVNGGRQEYNNWQVDGANILDTGSNATINVSPNVDAIAEFRVLTSDYGAQYGRNGSGNVQVETKSGTKDFHGDVFEYLRNDFFNANTFFNNAAGRNPDGTQVNPRPPYKKHDFGYTIGGPFYIPGHYNSNKNKTFFFWSEEWRRELNIFGFNQPVPSDAERGLVSGNQTNTADFTDICTATPSECPTGVNPAAVPIDPNALAMLKALIPRANVGSGANSSFITTASEPFHWRQELARVDQNLGSKLRLMGRYIHDSYQQTDPTVSFVGNPFPVIQTNENVPGSSFVVHLTATISPTLLNEFVASYAADHLILSNTGPCQFPSGIAAPMTGLFNTASQSPCSTTASGGGGSTTTLFQFPAVSISTNNGAYGGGFTVNPGFMPWINSNPVYDYRDTVTKIIGSHNLTFGGEFVAAQKNEPSAPTGVGLGGALNFSEGTPVSTGNAFADFLTGNIATYAQTSAIVKYYYRYKIFEPYLQDDWRVNKHLTLNLGLRISLFGTNRDRSRTSVNFDPTFYKAAAAPTIDLTGNTTGVSGALIPGSGNPFNGFVQCGGPGGTSLVPGPILAAFPGATIAGTSLPGCQKGHLFNPAPRLGFAWDPHGDGKMAIRGGYGIFFEYGNGNEANAESLEGTPPRVLTASEPNIAPGFGACPSTNTTGYTCIGGGALPPPLINDEPPGVIINRAIWPYVQQWHVDVQRELPSHFVGMLSYVGSKGTHLTDVRDLNQLHSIASQGIQNPYAPGQAIKNSDCNNFTTDPVTGFPTAATLGNGTPVPSGAVPNLWVACGNDADPFRPFVGSSTLEFLETQANSHYHALQASVRRTLGSLTVNAAYTYSHSIDNSSDRGDTSFVDSYNLSSNKGSSSFDQRHVLNLGYIYDLPFFNKSSGLMKTLLGGWQWSGITSLQSGLPVNVTNGRFGDSAGTGNSVEGRSSVSRPDLVGNPQATPCRPSTQPGPYLANPCAFAAPQGLTFGDVGRNVLNLPHRTNFDMGIFKRFAIKESQAVEFRWETFNTFNHTQFNRVFTNFTPTSSTFLTARDARLPRIMQFALKLIF